MYRYAALIKIYFFNEENNTLDVFFIGTAWTRMAKCIFTRGVSFVQYIQVCTERHRER